MLKPPFHLSRAGCFNLTFSLLLALLVSVALPAQASGDFALLDQEGRFHQLSRYAGDKAVLLYIYQNSDEVSHAAVQALNALNSAYANQGIRVLLLNPVDSREAVQSEVAARDIQLPVLIDEAQLVAATLDVTHSGELLILNPENFDLLYRGPLPPATPLHNMADALAAGEPLPASFNPAADGGDAATNLGASITFRGPLAADAPAISYQTQIVPLLQRYCTVCHVENGLAPWAMTSHIMVLGWSPMIRETVLTRRMPPGQIDMQVGRWHKAPHITPEDQALLIAWIDAGAPRDGETDPLAGETAPAPEWPLGVPDLIVEVPEQAVPATGTVDFIVARAPLALEEDKWLSAVSYAPGDRTVLHSLMVFARDTQPGLDPVAALSDEHSEFISVYVPGEQADEFPEDAGFLLEKNKDLVFKIRYITSGRQATDSTRIGLYFRHTPPAFVLHGHMLGKQSLTIPPEAGDHLERAVMPIPYDVQIEMISPHAHGRASSMSISATQPSGTEEQRLINIASYNFNWQMAYRPRPLIDLGAGSTLSAETIYDNSLANPYNPDPSIAVQWGVSDAAEMFSHYVRLMRPNDQANGATATP